MNDILILSFSPLGRDPRVRRQIEALRDAGPVVAAGLSDPAMRGADFVALPMPDRSRLARAKQAMFMTLRAYEAYYWQQAHIRAALERLSARSFRAILANDIEALPLALRLANGARVVFDAHEYAPGELEHSFLWRFFLQSYKTYLCRRYMPQADVRVTVGPQIAEAYRRETGVACEVSMNFAAFHDLAPRATDPARIRIIHHGVASPERGLEKTVRMAQLLDERFETTFVLVPGNENYIRALHAMAAGHPRIRFVEPVPFDAIVPMLHAYDIGVFLLEPIGRNGLYALPNKLFEFIQARLMVAIGPSPAMAEIVERYGCGVVAEDFSPEMLARRLNALSAEDIGAYKQASHRAAAQLHAGVAAADWRRWVAGE